MNKYTCILLLAIIVISCGKKNEKEPIFISVDGDENTIQAIEEVLDVYEDIYITNLEISKYKIKIQEPDPNIDYSICIVEPDPNVDFKMILVNPEKEITSAEIETIVEDIRKDNFSKAK